MIFNNEIFVMFCEDDCYLFMVQFDFMGIDDFESKLKDLFVDVIGICKSYEDVIKIIVRFNNREVVKRNIYLMDIFGKVVIVMLWGEDVDKFDGFRQFVLVIKGVRVFDFGGWSFFVLFLSIIIVNFDILEVYKFCGWFDVEG